MFSPGELTGQERPGSDVPFGVAFRVGKSTTPDFVPGCGYAYGTVGFELRSTGTWAVVAGFEHFLNLGGDDVFCLGETYRRPDGSTGLTESGFDFDGAERLEVGVVRRFGLADAALEIGPVTGIFLADAPSGSAHVWLGGIARAVLLTHGVLGLEVGWARYPALFPHDGTVEHRWGRAALISVGLRL